MFIGIYALLAGLLFLGETLGFIDPQAKWGLPLALACFGSSELWNVYKARQKGTVRS